jgi:hypothetical protein
LHDGTDDRPADILVDHWFGGRACAFDVSVVSYDQANGIVARETLKNGKYLERVQQAGLDFEPLVLSSLGLLSSGFVKFLSRVGRARADCLGLEPHRSISDVMNAVQLIALKTAASFVCDQKFEDTS